MTRDLAWLPLAWIGACVPATGNPPCAPGTEYCLARSDGSCADGLRAEWLDTGVLSDIRLQADPLSEGVLLCCPYPHSVSDCAARLADPGSVNPTLVDGDTVIDLAGLGSPHGPKHLRLASGAELRVTAARGTLQTLSKSDLESLPALPAGNPPSSMVHVNFERSVLYDAELSFETPTSGLSHIMFLAQLGSCQSHSAWENGPEVTTCSDTDSTEHPMDLETACKAQVLESRWALCTPPTRSMVETSLLLCASAPCVWRELDQYTLDERQRVRISTYVLQPGVYALFD